MGEEQPHLVLENRADVHPAVGLVGGCEPKLVGYMRDHSSGRQLGENPGLLDRRVKGLHRRLAHGTVVGVVDVGSVPEPNGGVVGDHHLWTHLPDDANQLLAQLEGGLHHAVLVPQPDHLRPEHGRGLLLLLASPLDDPLPGLGLVVGSLVAVGDDAQENRGALPCQGEQSSASQRFGVIWMRKNR